MPDRVSGDSLFWNFTSLHPFQEAAIDLSLAVGAPLFMMMEIKSC